MSNNLNNDLNTINKLSLDLIQFESITPDLNVIKDNFIDNNFITKVIDKTNKIIIGTETLTEINPSVLSITDRILDNKIIIKNISNDIIKSYEKKDSNNMIPSILSDYLTNKVRFNPEMAINQFSYYQYKKSNKYPFKKAANILALTLLTMGCLISRVSFDIVHSNDIFNDSYQSKPVKKIIIKLFYYVRVNRTNFVRRMRNKYFNTDYNNNLLNNQNKTDNELRNNILALYEDKFNLLMEYLSNLFGTVIDLQLTRVQKTHYDSNILVQAMGLQTYTKRLNVVMYNTFDKAKKLRPHLTGNTTGTYPSYLSGIFIRGAGRFFRQRIIPRRTVKELQRGTLSHVNVIYTNTSKFIGKTKRGSYCLTVKIGHIFF